MPLIEKNFDEVPDVIQPVAAGNYSLECVGIPKFMDTNDKKSKKVVVEYEIRAPGHPDDGRKVFDHIGLKAPTRLKRCALSAGISAGAGGIDTDELAGKIVKARIKNRTYQDPDGVTKETSGIEDYYIPGEPGPEDDD